MKKSILNLFIIFLISNFSADAQTWSELGGLNAFSPNSYILSICSDPSGNIYACGKFTTGGSSIFGDNVVAKWNGSTWSRLLGLPSPAYEMGVYTGINCVCSDASGNIYAGGGFVNSSGNYYVAKWNGSNWSELGGLNSFTPNAGVFYLFCDQKTGFIYAGGYSTDGADSKTGGKYVAMYNGTSWSKLGGTTLAANGATQTICSDKDGNIYVAGEFKNANGKCYVTKWNGTAWSELGGLDGLKANNTIQSICSDPAGNIYAAGKFSNGAYSFQGLQYVAKWNGTTWSEVGGLNALSANYYINSICSDAKGNIYAGGDFFWEGHGYVAKWDGTTWSETGGATGTLASNSTINTICTDKAGNIFAAGHFTNSSGLNYVAKYNSGTTGINQITQGKSLNIFPNPTKGRFTITFPAFVNYGSVEIYTSSGKRIFNEPTYQESKKEINLNNIPQGIYMVRLYDGEKYVSQKIVMQ
jgi:hypothetical protein